MTALIIPSTPTTDVDFQKWRWDGEKWVVMPGWLPLTGGTLTGTLGLVGPKDIVGRTAGVPNLTRWRIVLGDDAPELGANSGSNFRIERYADNGALIDAPLMIRRSDGWVTFPRGVDFTQGPWMRVHEVGGALRFEYWPGYGTFMTPGHFRLEDVQIQAWAAWGGAGGAVDGRIIVDAPDGHAQLHFHQRTGNLGVFPQTGSAGSFSLGDGAWNEGWLLRSFLALGVVDDTGGNQGYDFCLQHFSDDAFQWLDDPGTIPNPAFWRRFSLWITRSNGVVTVTQTPTVVSDAALKENVQTITRARDIIERLRGVDYRHRETRERAYGLIAQEVQEVAPEIVRKTGDHLGVSYEQVIPILVEAVKNLNEEVTALEDR